MDVTLSWGESLAKSVCALGYRNILYTVDLCGHHSSGIRTTFNFSLHEPTIDTAGLLIGLNANQLHYYEFKQARKEMLYLTTHSTHFIYDYMASDIW